MWKAAGSTGIRSNEPEPPSPTWRWRQRGHRRKKAFRRAVNQAHAQVPRRTKVGVGNAFDPELQLWVAACLYKGFVRRVSRLHRRNGRRYSRSPLPRRHGAQDHAAGSTRDVAADRAAFNRYWEQSLGKLHIDDAVRDYLYPIAVSRMPGIQLPWPAGLYERFALLITTGFLPQRFRDEMKLDWDPVKQEQFDRVIALVRFVNKLTPSVVIRRFRSTASARPRLAYQEWSSAGVRAARSARLAPVLIEHHRSKESGHPAQVVGLADMQDVIAGNQCSLHRSQCSQSASACWGGASRSPRPVMTDEACDLWRPSACNSVVSDRPMPLSLPAHRSAPWLPPPAYLPPPIVERRFRVHHRNVGYHGLEAIIDRCGQSRCVSAERHPGERDAVDSVRHNQSTTDRKS